jgi:catechol 2,3-dioxygenase-like lactoylglutathione lyase family enzyme
MKRRDERTHGLGGDILSAVNTSKFLPALFLFAFCASASVAQVDAPSLRPSLVGLQVNHLDVSVQWYVSQLGFRQKDRKDFPQRELKLAILALQDFELELVENARTVRKTDALAGKDSADITGFAKVTFTVNGVAALFRRLKSQGARFAMELRDSNTDPGKQHFVVLDPDGNWLQFIGKKS